MPIKKEKTARLAVAALAELYPEAVCSLDYDGDPWRLLVLSRLSAQCTDARVNIVAKPLFEAYPDARAMANAEQSALEQIVYPCGLYRTKARDLIAMSALLLEKHAGRVPDTMEELLELPGVGRKIANLVLGDVFGKGGIVADTHCIRITGRLGLVESKNPVVVERALEALIPKDAQTDFCHRLVQFGRDICSAKATQCESCPLNGICPQLGVENKQKA